MELINQHTKAIMEGCKERAREFGLRFEDETLEYIVTNRDLLELSPKAMIPTMYDYWVHDVEVLKEKGRYELYPGNPYETVINTRPVISFYNDNNPDWLNVMIFYHVIGHIDFFQNNVFYRHTWDYDFNGRALSDKRMIANLRSEHGRWVDYIIEFSRGIDNTVGFHRELSALVEDDIPSHSKAVDFYFDEFLQSLKETSTTEYIKEIERYNNCRKQHGVMFEDYFFTEVYKTHPEFRATLAKHLKDKKPRPMDLMQFIVANSDFLNKEENTWMQSVIEVVRHTSIFFQPQIRTKIMNEGWASYWHDRLFLQDSRITGHEVDFSRVHSGVASLPRVGLNPYALGMRLFEYAEELENKGKCSLEFERLQDARLRKEFDRKTGTGRLAIFDHRKNLCDFMFVNRFLDQDFVDRHKLFVAGRRLNRARMVWEYYVKSRKAEAYRKMLEDKLYHPPYIEVDENANGDNTLYLVHRFENKPLVKEFIKNTMLGIEYLWGGPVKLETSDVVSVDEDSVTEGEEPTIEWERVVYTMKNRELSRERLEDSV